MNANELADALFTVENYYTEPQDEVLISQAATMLRQQQAEINNWKDQYQRLNENLEMWKDGHFKQQAEIEVLKQIIDANNLSQNIGQFVKAANKPVAWTDGKGNYFDKNSFFPVDDLIPLYTHPVSKAKDRFSNYESICLQCGTTIYKPFKELTDEEIMVLYEEYIETQYASESNVLGFGRAILRKAQEK